MCVWDFHCSRRQQGCFFFLLSGFLFRPRRMLVALSVCSLSEQIESKQIPYFLILTSAADQETRPQVYQNKSVRRVLQKQGEGVF
jgi:hypothetical protein